MSAIQPDKVSPRNIYAARKPGWHGYVAVVVNDPRWAKETGKELADWIKHGYEVVGLVTREESAEGLREFVAEQKRRASEPAQAVLPQDGLFA